MIKNNIFRDVKKVKGNKPKIQNHFLYNGSTPRTLPPFTCIMWGN